MLKGWGSRRGERQKACSVPGHTPATCSSCHPPLLPKAGPPIGLSHIRQWLAAKPHNPKGHKSSTMCLNKRAAVEAVPRGCGAGMSFFRCRGPFIKTSVSFGSKINQYSHPFMAQGKAFHNLCFGQPWLLKDNQSAGSKGSCPTQGLSHPIHRAELAIQLTVKEFCHQRLQRQITDTTTHCPRGQPLNRPQKSKKVERPISRSS